MVDLAFYAQIAWSSLANSSYYVLFAVAFAVVLKTTKIWNFAQAGLMGVAFYITYWGLNGLQLPGAAAMALGLAATVALGYGVERVGFHTLRERGSGSMSFFIFTLIFAEFVIYTLTLFFGTEPVTLYRTIVFPVHFVGGIVVTQWDLIGLAVTAGLLLLLYIFLQRSKTGQHLVAVSTSSHLAELYGISSNRAYVVSILVASLFIWAGMYLFGMKLSVTPNTSLELMLFAVAANILGGIGNIFGAAFSALILSLVQGFSILVIPSRWQGALLYAFLFVIIIFLPRGFPSLFSRATR